MWPVAPTTTTFIGDDRSSHDLLPLGELSQSPRQYPAHHSRPPPHLQCRSSAAVLCTTRSRRARQMLRSRRHPPIQMIADARDVVGHARCPPDAGIRRHFAEEPRPVPRQRSPGSNRGARLVRRGARHPDVGVVGQPMPRVVTTTGHELGSALRGLGVARERCHRGR